MTKTMSEFKRRALIFGNMGVKGDEGSEYIDGVNLDLNNFYNFIRSDEGGAWMKSEIIPFSPNEINKTQLLNRIKDEGHVDYWLIFFSGHGGSDEVGNDYIEVKPEALDDDWLCYIYEIVAAVGRTRMTLITDACRSYCPINESAEQPEIRYFSEGGVIISAKRLKCREVYNNALMSLPSPSYYIAQSCTSLESSNDSGEYGGEYISALIGKAKSLAAISHLRKLRTHDLSPVVISISSVHDAAVPVVVRKTFDTQHPTFRGPKTKRPPFAVSV